MLCPKCNVEAAISATRYVTVNDDTDKKETQLFIEQDFQCRNPQCSDFRKIIYTARNPIQLSKPE